MFDKRHFNALYRDGIPTLLLEGPGVGRQQGISYCPLREMALSGRLDGPLGNLGLRQVFRGPGMEPEKTVEAVYRFPLPGDAVVKSVAVSFGKVRIETTLARREKARDDYEDAFEEGRQAVLLEKEGAGVFTLRIAGLRSGEDVTVETGFLLWLRPRRGACELRVPLTLAPRYTRDDEGMKALRRQPLGVAWDPGYRFNLELECRELGAPESLTHPLRTESLDAGYRLFLEEQGAFPDQDCVIRFPVEAGAEGISLRSFGWGEEGRQWFLALVQAPDNKVHETVPREIILLVDRSGSMSGPKWEAASWGVRSLLSGLGEDEVFNVGYFDQTVEWFRNAGWFGKRGLPIGEKDVLEALSMLDHIRPRGGTELGVALEQSLSMPRTRGNFARHVVILTDGQVTDAERIFKLVDRESQKKNRRRISVVCIDSAPNQPLVTGLAEKGGGEAVFLTSNPEESDITTALEEVLEGMARPLRQDLFLCAKNGRIREASGVKRPVRAGGRDGIELGGLPMGRPVWVAGWLKGAEKAELVLASPDGEMIAESGPAENPAESVKALCGALRVSRLERLLETEPSEREIEEVLGSMGLESEDRDAPLYPENRELQVSERIREALAKESMAAGIVSTETAFVAVRSEAGQKVSETLVVPSMRPRGWSGEFDTTVCASLPKKKSYRPDVYHERATLFPLDRVQMCRMEDPGPLRQTPVKRSLMFPPLLLFQTLPSGGNPCFDDSGVAVLIRREKIKGEQGDLLLKKMVVSIDPALAAELAPAADTILFRLFVGNMATPRVEVSLKALLGAGGSRPLNIRVTPDEALECRLLVPNIAGLREKFELSLEIQTA
jgi:Ca-activated chloride channel family protein